MGGKKLTDEELKALVKQQVEDNAEKDWDKATKAERDSADEMSGYWESR
jgi:hypothetical protein